MTEKLGRAKTGTKIHARPATGNRSYCGVYLPVTVPAKVSADLSPRAAWIELAEVAGKRGVPCDKCFNPATLGVLAEATR
jgi:hypothetical protein